MKLILACVMLLAFSANSSVLVSESPKRYVETTVSTLSPGWYWEVYRDSVDKSWYSYAGGFWELCYEFEYWLYAVEAKPDTVLYWRVCRVEPVERNP